MKSPASLLLAVLAAFTLSAAAQQPAPAAPEAAKPASAAPAAQAPAKLNPAEGEAKFAAVCLACHGPGGNSAIPANPSLSRQHAEYIVKQLTEFKSGKRASPIMQGFAAMLSDADMKNIAAYLNVQKPQTGTAKDKVLVRLGESIYRGGILDRRVAACAGCHSPNGAGIPAQYPRLAGQHTDYVVAQLKAFRDGTRKNSQQMSEVAARMNDREIAAVADYIAGLR